MHPNIITVNRHLTIVSSRRLLRPEDSLFAFLCNLPFFDSTILSNEQDCWVACFETCPNVLEVLKPRILCAFAITKEIFPYSANKAL